MIQSPFHQNYCDLLFLKTIRFRQSPWFEMNSKNQFFFKLQIYYFLNVDYKRLQLMFYKGCGRGRVLQSKNNVKGWICRGSSDALCRGDPTGSSPETWQKENCRRRPRTLSRNTIRRGRDARRPSLRSRRRRKWRAAASGTAAPSAAVSDLVLQPTARWLSSDAGCDTTSLLVSHRLSTTPWRASNIQV